MIEAAQDATPTPADATAELESEATAETQPEATAEAQPAASEPPPDEAVPAPEQPARPQADGSEEARREAPMPAAPKPNKFIAQLTNAMHAAAKKAREESVGRIQADAKAFIEEVHARSAAEASELRRQADDDIAGIREWSKAEIARIREETEVRINGRKSRLESEIEDHAATIERQIERVQGRVSRFEQEMVDFFERLLAEEDPTRLAALASQLPEAPPWDADPSAAQAAAIVEPATDAAAATSESHGQPVEAVSAEPISVETEAAPDPVDAEAAMIAIQTAAETAAVGDEPAPADPRLAALALSPDLGAAEAEAAVAAESSEEIEIPTITDDALAARLAGLVENGEGEATTPAKATQVVVSGLVSVASIASFKRHLGRLPGVQSVGVSSGPEGEFIFAVSHGEATNLRDAVATLPGFGARVTGASDQVVNVTARDPENEA